MLVSTVRLVKKTGRLIVINSPFYHTLRLRLDSPAWITIISVSVRMLSFSRKCVRLMPPVS